MDNMNNNNAVNLNAFKAEANHSRLEAASRSTSLKEAKLQNDANMASKRKADWSSLNEKADQLHIRQAKMDLADIEKKVRAAEDARTPRFTEEEMKEVKTTSISKGFWIGTLLTAVVGGYIAYRKIKSKKEEIEYLEKKIEEMKKSK